MSKGDSDKTENLPAEESAAAMTGQPECPEDIVDDNSPRLRVLDYLVLLKPRVMSLVVFTALVGLLLAPGGAGLWINTVAVFCIAIGAGASGAINMWYDHDIDIIMSRTRKRPVPSGRVGPRAALVFGIVLSVFSVALMALVVNVTAAGLLAFTIFYYIFIYTMWLKRRTPQNIVIGGAAGAFPPMIGWIATTGEYGAEAGMLFAIIFLWTPPHSWALALFSNEDYTNAGVPMMPVVAGRKKTKLLMAFYTVLLLPATLSPVYLGFAGLIYGAVAVILGLGFVYHMVRVLRDDEGTAARPMFFYSIFYLFLIFVFLLVDRALFITI